MSNNENASMTIDAVIEALQNAKTLHPNGKFPVRARDSETGETFELFDIFSDSYNVTILLEKE